jgi:hypothetical protein
VAGGWKTKPASAAYGGSLLLAGSAAEILSTTFSGTGVAVVAPIGPRRGTLQARVDGGAWQLVRLASPKGQQRRVVWSRPLPAGSHELEIQGVDGQVALDAILLLD